MGLNHAEVSKGHKRLAQNIFLGNGTRDKDFCIHHSVWKRGLVLHLFESCLKVIVKILKLSIKKRLGAAQRLARRRTGRSNGPCRGRRAGPGQQRE